MFTKIGKGGNCNALQLEGRPTWHQSFWPNYEANNAPAYKFSNSATDILAIGEHLSVSLTQFALRMSRNGISELPVKILTSPLDLATPIS